MKSYNNAKEFAEAIKREHYEYEQDAEGIEMRKAAPKKQYKRVITKESLNSMLRKEFDALN